MPKLLELVKRMLAGMGAQRISTHGVLAGLTGFGLWVAAQYYGVLTYIFTFGFGYVCLIFVSVSLLLGPINLLRKRFNPVNIDLRRDVGIWAGITGVLHVIFALIERNRGNLLAFFFRRDGRPLLNLSGASNWIGAFATVLIVLLLAISNDLALRALRGKRWKQLQRLNYALVVLAFLHTIGYQIAGGREQIVKNVTALVVVIVLVVQLAGVSIYQRRKRAHEPVKR